MSGSDCDSDHFMVKMKIKIRLKKWITTKPTIFNRYDITNFKGVEYYKRFKNEIYIQ